MITYDTLKELAQALSRLTGYRYVAFSESGSAGLFIALSHSEMEWITHKSLSYGFWSGGMNVKTLNLGALPNLDWSQCLFDCKEK